MEFVRRPIFFLIPLFVALFVIVQFILNQFSHIQGFVSANIGMGDEMVKVAFVIDGDTIELTDGRRVRYIGIDAPEKKKCFSEDAKEENKRLVAGKAVRLKKDVSETDSYKRLLRYVYVDDIFVNGSLVGDGYAKAWDVPPNKSNKDMLFTLQKDAKDAGRGLWQLCR